MKLTAGILAHTDEQYLSRCLETLIAQEGLGNLGETWNIVVRDNGAPEKAYLQEAQKKFPQVTFLMNEDNAGFARGHNDIMRRHSAEFHAVLNNDVLYSPKYLATLLNTLQSNEALGSATGKLFHWDFDNDKKTTVIDSAGMAVTPSRYWKERGQGEEDRGQYDKQEVVFGGSGAAVIYRRSALEKVEDEHGFYDERIFMYKEDCDLAERLNAAKFHCLYVPTAIAWHARTASSQVKRPERSMRERAGSAVNESLIIRKHKKSWPLCTRLLCSGRQFCKWQYLRMFERDVYKEAMLQKQS